MISDQVAPINWDDAAQCYVIQIPALAGFGAEAFVDFDLACRLSREFECGAISLALPTGEVIRALGIIGQKSPKQAEYVELDDWSRPIVLMSENGLRAATAVHELLREANRTDKLTNDLCQRLVDLTSKETFQLGLALFRRIREFNERASQAIPVATFHLLPWELLNAHLSALNSLMRSEPPDQCPTSLPDLDSYFKDVNPHLSISLRELTEWKDRPTWRDVAYFVSAVWESSIEHFPAASRDILFRSIKNSDIFLRRQSALLSTQHPRDEAILVAQARCRANLLLNRIREVGAKGYPHRRVQNLETALVIASKAGFFGRRFHLLDRRTVRDVKSTAAELPHDPDIFLAETKEYFSDPKRRRSVDPLKLLHNYALYAAEVCKFAGSICYKFEDNRREAKSFFEKAEGYYELARCMVDSPRLRKRWSRKLMLEAEISDDDSKSRKAYQRALELLDTLTHERPDSSEEYGRSTLQARALFGLARYSTGLAGEDLVLKERFMRSIANADPEWASPILMAEFYAEIENNYVAALSYLDDWLAARRSVRGKRFLEYVEFYAAELAIRFFEETPSRGADAVERLSVLLKNQPGNIIALDRLLELSSRVPAELVDACKAAILKHLLPISSTGCPITHAAAHVLWHTSTASQQSLIETRVDALVALLSDLEQIWASAEQYLLTASGATPDFLGTLEVLSKWYFEAGRTQALLAELHRSERLLRVCRGFRPEDAIWISRQIEVAIITKKFDDADHLIQMAPPSVSDDPIFQLQSARLKLAQGRTDDAANVLQGLSTKQKGQPPQIVHPAVLDNLAYIALLRNDIQAAQSFYSSILDQNSFDARALFGMGRTFLIRGAEWWHVALRYWRAALRLEVQRDNTHTNKHKWFTACSIAGLFREIDGAVHFQSLLDELRKCLTEEDPSVSSIVVQALRHVGITDDKVAALLMISVRNAAHFGLRKRVAQFLQNVAIDAVLRGTDSERGLYELISWCRENEVITDFIGAGRSSCARILLRMINDRIDIVPRIDALKSAEVRDFTIGELTTPIAQAPVALVTRGLKALVANNSTETAREGLLKGLVTNTALWRIRDLLNGESVSLPEVAGFVDRDLLNVLARERGVSQWRLADTRVEGTSRGLPALDEIRIFNAGGIFFRKTFDESGEVSVYFRSVPPNAEVGRFEPLVVSLDPAGLLGQA